MKKQLNAVSAFIVKDGKVLLIQRNKEPWLYKWGTPGGKIQAGETPEEAVIREINEEIGVRFKPEKRLKTYHIEDDEYSVNTILFAGSIDGEITIEEKEVVQCKWLSADEALALPLASTNKN